MVFLFSENVSNMCGALAHVRVSVTFFVHVTSGFKFPKTAATWRLWDLLGAAFLGLSTATHLCLPTAAHHARSTMRGQGCAEKDAVSVREALIKVLSEGPPLDRPLAGDCSAASVREARIKGLPAAPLYLPSVAHQCLPTATHANVCWAQLYLPSVAHHCLLTATHAGVCWVRYVPW